MDAEMDEIGMGHRPIILSGKSGSTRGFGADQFRPCTYLAFRIGFGLWIIDFSEGQSTEIIQ
jgi:hypothetical protein